MRKKAARQERRYVSLGKVGYIDKTCNVALTDKNSKYHIENGDDIQIGDKLIFDKVDRKTFIRRDKK